MATINIESNITVVLKSGAKLFVPRQNFRIEGIDEYGRFKAVIVDMKLPVSPGDLLQLECTLTEE
jgi:hypothetical protein